MKYNSKIGILENVKILFNERNMTNSQIFNNKNNAEKENLETLSFIVESVIDEFNAFIGEEV